MILEEIYERNRRRRAYTGVKPKVIFIAPERMNELLAALTEKAKYTNPTKDKLDGKEEIMGMTIINDLDELVIL